MTTITAQGTTRAVRPRDPNETLIRDPDTGKAQPVIRDKRWNEYEWYQKAGYIGGLFFTTAQILMFMVIVGLFYQDFRIEHTYYRAGTTNCASFYEMDVNRYFLLFVVALNIVDFPLSYALGTKFWGGLTLWSNAIAAAANFILFWIAVFAFGVTCNNQGNGGRRNLCDDRRACGVDVYMAQTANACQFRNPLNLTMTPATTLADLAWDGVFLAFFLMFIVYMLMGIAKFALALLLPESTDLTIKTASAAKKLVEQIDKLRKTDDKLGLLTQKTKTKVRNIYDKMEFLDLLKMRHVVGYFVAAGFNAVAVLLVGTWLGWFQQNSQAIKQGFFQSGAHTTYEHAIPDWVAYTVYAAFALHVLLLALNVRLGQVFSTQWAMAASVIGAILSTMGLFILIFYFMIGCNQDGSAHNICNNRQKWCATYGSNPVNDCPNVAYTCPATFPVSAFQGFWAYDLDFILLFLITAWLWLTYLVTFTVAYFLHKRYVMYTQPVPEIQNELRDKREKQPPEEWEVYDTINGEFDNDEASIDSKWPWETHVPRKLPSRRDEVLPNDFALSGDHIWSTVDALFN